MRLAWRTIAFAYAYATQVACGFVDGDPIVAGATAAGDGGGAESSTADTSQAETGSGTDGGSSNVCTCDDRLAGERCLRFVNACDQTVWAGASGDEDPEGALDIDVALGPGDCHAMSVRTVVGGRAWGRTACVGDTCASDGASGRGTLVQFNIGAEHDVYDVSLVDAFNLPMAMVPIGVDQATCAAASCAADLLVVCPEGLGRPTDQDPAYCESICRACTVCPECNDCAGVGSAACDACGVVADTCCAGTACASNEYSMLWESLCPDAIVAGIPAASFSCDQQSDFDIVFCP